MSFFFFLSPLFASSRRSLASSVTTHLEEKRSFSISIGWIIEGEKGIRREG